MERVLSREFDLDIASRTNGLEGIKYAEKYIPKLIILDLMLPGMDGFEILKRLRKNPEFKDTKILILSAKSRSEDIEKGFELTADEYITKPFQPKEFIVRIKNLLKKQT